jgi:dethiobiotin synthetase
MPARGLFVTGTDTGVGKTGIACGLIRAARAMGWRAAGMKPVAAGTSQIRGRYANADVEALAAASGMRIARRLCNPYLLAPAIAPHIAAAEAGVRLEIDVMVRAYRALARRAEVVIVEGAGGFLVPLDERVDMGDLAARLRLPIILVVGMRLGCISHALLTAEAIERRGLHLAGWVANRIDPAMHRYRHNVASLRARLAAPLLAEVTFGSTAHRRRLAIDGALDTERLHRWLSHDAFSSRR